MDLTLDVGDLTLGEVEELEEITGLMVEDFGPGLKFTAKIATALIYLQQKRIDPAYTLEEARKVKLSEFNVVARPIEEAASETP